MLQWAIFGWLLALTSLASAQTVGDPGLQVTEFVAGLSSPTTMAFIGPDDILVLQKADGQVRRVVGGVLQPNPVLDAAVDSLSERGLLGIALHPNFPASAFVYLYYTESGTGADSTGSPTPLGNRVYRFTWDGAALIDATVILDLPVTPGPNHDGGIITFGPDGKLYVVIGDLNRNGQLQNFPSGPAPDDTSVILRLNDDGTIPGDNPFFAQGGNLARYFAYGIRNSFGLAFDPVTDKLWMTVNGPNAFDEIDLVEPGLNSGWEQIMGPDDRDPQGLADLFQVPGSHYSDPEFSWFETVGPTAIVFLSSTQLGAQYENNAFVGDINNGNLYSFSPNAARDGFEFQNPDLADLVADNDVELAETIFGTGFEGITDLKVGPDGLLYVLSFELGKIFVISRLPASSDLSIVKSDSSDPLPVGSNLTYTLAVTNGGPDAATGMVVTDALPAGATFVSSSTTQGSCSGTSTVTCGLGGLANGATATVTIIIRPRRAGTLTNTASVTAVEADPDLANNTATATTAVIAPDLIESSLSNPPSAAALGATFSVTDTARNQGAADAGASTTRYYLSLDTRKSNTDKLLTGTRAVPGLTVGAESAGTVDVTVPLDTISGTYFLLACADDLRAVRESSERNNCRASTTTVAVGP